MVSPRVGPACPGVGATVCCAASAATNASTNGSRFSMGLPEEILVGVGPVDAHVTGGAALEFGVEQVVARGLQNHAAIAIPGTGAAAIVALEAHGEHHRAAQQLGIGGAVRIVA